MNKAKQQQQETTPRILKIRNSLIKLHHKFVVRSQRQRGFCGSEVTHAFQGREKSLSEAFEGFPCPLHNTEVRFLAMVGNCTSAPQSIALISMCFRLTSSGQPD
jgi:hypothetical protein